MTMRRFQADGTTQAIGSRPCARPTATEPRLSPFVEAAAKPPAKTVESEIARHHATTARRPA
jgi:hypothetical protein